MIRHTCGSVIPPDIETYVRHLASCPDSGREISAWCHAIVRSVAHEKAHGETPSVPQDSTLADLISDLSDTGPDTPVDPRQPGYALALLVDAAMSQSGNPDYERGLGERVFSALAKSETPTETTETRDLTPAEMHAMHRDGEGDSLRDIARLAGVAPETVRRRINKWKQAGAS